MVSEWRFILVQDNDCHWYVIPQQRAGEWKYWRNTTHEDDGGWDVPSYATEVGGSPSLVSFTKFEIDGASPSPGIVHEGCNYLAAPDSICTKCGQLVPKSGASHD